MDDISRKDAPEKRQPKWLDPMLATLTHDRFSASGWIYERKFDGERVLIFREDGKTRLMSRNKKDISSTYPEIVEAVNATRPENFIADGEIVAFDGKVTSFSRLQQRMKTKDPDEALRGRIAVYCYLFDLPFADGRDFRGVPLRGRKKALKELIAFGGKLRFTTHRNKKGVEYYEKACRKGWEGVIAKKADSRYAGGRSRNWLKFKCEAGQELVIGGYTAPKGERSCFGALLLGYYEDGEFRYAGRVGTGFDEKTLADLKKRMKKIETADNPYDEDVDGDGVTFVKPKLVAEIGFTEWTGDGKLRHPRYLGLRRDKKARDVVREG